MLDLLESFVEFVYGIIEPLAKSLSRVARRIFSAKTFSITILLTMLLQLLVIVKPHWLVIVRTQLFNFFAHNQLNREVLLPLAVIGGVFASFVLSYLERTSSIKSKLESNYLKYSSKAFEDRRLLKRLEELKEQVRESGQDGSNYEAIRLKLAADDLFLRQVFSQGASKGDSVLGSLEQRLTAHVDNHYKKLAEIVAGDSSVLPIFDSAQERIKDEIRRLTRSANLNLVIGSTTTVVALVLLIIMVSTSAETPTDAYKVALIRFIPRLSTVVFVEIFAFFFLNLYKSNLTEIRYYQDELTSLSRSRIALVAARTFNEGEALQQILITLASIPPRPPDTPDKAINVGEVADLAERLATLAKNGKAGK